MPIVPACLVRSADEAALAVERLNAPAALKIVSPDIAHKTEVGGVRLNVFGADHARSVFTEIMASVTAHAPTARVHGISVAPVLASGVELIVGVVRDPQWGPALLVGLGGLFAEALRDTQIASPETLGRR